MKKIVVASDSKKFTSLVMHLLSQLHEEEPLFVVGGFSHSLNYAKLIESTTQPYVGLVVDLVEQDRHAVDENILLFEHYCHHNHIKYRVHEEDHAFEIDNLVNESRFADLLISNGNLLNKNQANQRSTIYIKQALHKAECPVLLVPEDYKPFKRIAITYDGKKESMFALKQFCYLFPQFSSLPTEIVYLSEDDDEVPKLSLLKEYVAQNFSNINIEKIHLHPKNDLASWASEKKEMLVIAGSYSRSGLFNSIIDSFIDPILEMQQLPVFITHP